jgi:xanthine/uracil permease
MPEPGEGIEGAENTGAENVGTAEAPTATAPTEAVATQPVTVETTKSETVALDKNGDKIYPSLYDSIPTTFGAILLGGAIVGGIQWIVKSIFEREKKEHKALTQFVTSMFAFIVGIWIADKLIAGPSAQLLWENESREVLTFIKDITLMVFAYYFGTKANVPSDDAERGG